MGKIEGEEQQTANRGLAIWGLTPKGTGQAVIKRKFELYYSHLKKLKKWQTKKAKKKVNPIKADKKAPVKKAVQVHQMIQKKELLL